MAIIAEIVIVLDIIIIISASLPGMLHPLLITNTLKQSFSDIIPISVWIDSKK